MKTFKTLLAILSTLVTGVSFAASQTITESPTNWRLQNHDPNIVAVWYTSSPCINGQLLLPGGSSQEERDRLWDTVTNAKASGLKMIITYDDGIQPPATTPPSGGCRITSFGLDRGSRNGAITASAFRSSGSGKVTQVWPYAGNRVLFTTANFVATTQRDPQSACRVDANGDRNEQPSWAISLDSESGRAMFSTLMLAMSLSKEVQVYGSGFCDVYSPRERPYSIQLSG